MLAADFIQWWYGKGLKWVINGVRGRITNLTLMFSVPLLLRTLFAPWRQIISYGGKSISDRAKAMLDNLISRLVGGCVRLLVILTACLAIVGVAVGGVILIVAWPFLPIIAILLVVRGFLS